MGAGFFIALVSLGGIREIIGSRTFLGIQILPDAFEPWLIMILPAGAFLTLGLMLGFANMYTDRKKRIEKESLIEQYKRVSKVEISMAQEGI